MSVCVEVRLTQTHSCIRHSKAKIKQKHARMALKTKSTGAEPRRHFVPDELCQHRCTQTEDATNRLAEELGNLVRCYRMLMSVWRFSSTGHLGGVNGLR